MRASELSGAVLAVGSLITTGLAATNKFFSSRNACPQTCSTLGYETANWTVYRRTDRLKACNETMLLNFNIHNSLDSPDKREKISACVADGGTNTEKRGSINSSLATNSSSQATRTTVATVQVLSVGSGNSASTTNTIDAAAQLQNVIANEPAGETIRFAYLGGTIVGVYSGRYVDNAATSSLLQSLSDRLVDEVTDTTIMQVCGDGRNANNVLGVVADTTGLGLSNVQEVVAAWSNATCIDLGAAAEVTSFNITLTSTSTLKQRDVVRAPVPRSSECSTVQVVSGDSCSSLVGNPSPALAYT